MGSGVFNCAYEYSLVFIVSLVSVKDLNDDATVKAANGRELPLRRLLALVLNCLRSRAVLEIAKEPGLLDLLPSEIRWVLPVPSIWSPAAKRLMRLAASDAGFAADRADSAAAELQQLLLVRDADACALAVRPMLLRAALDPDFEPSHPDSSPLEFRAAAEQQLRLFVLSGGRLSSSPPPSSSLPPPAGEVVHHTAHAVASPVLSCSGTLYAASRRSIRCSRALQRQRPLVV